MHWSYFIVQKAKKTQFYLGYGALNWRIWEMSNDGKHHLHLKEYYIMQLL